MWYHMYVRQKFGQPFKNTQKRPKGQTKYLRPNHLAHKCEVPNTGLNHSDAYLSLEVRSDTVADSGMGISRKERDSNCSCSS